MIIDYVTGEPVPDVGAEANRQAVERVLVEEKGFARSDIKVDWPVRFSVAGHTYESAVDLLVFTGKQPFLVIKCAAGSLDSRKQEAVSAARILFDSVVPYAAASDGKDALVFDSVSAKQIGCGMEALPDVHTAGKRIENRAPVKLPEKRLEKERLIFRSYDSMNVNVGRRRSQGPPAGKGAGNDESGH